MTDIDPALKKFTDERGAAIIDAINDLRGIRPAARQLDIPESTIRSFLQSVKKKAVMQGYSPDHQLVHPVPAPLMVKRVSTNYDRDGAVSQQWVIAEPDKEKKLQMMMEAAQRSCENLPRLRPVRSPLFDDFTLCNVYTFTDYHLGMLASYKETGQDWNTQKAADMLMRVFSYMINRAPAAGTAIINQLGDFLHFDSILPVTPTSKHVLDADVRFTDLVEVSIRVLRQMIDLALARHSKVIVLLAEGNHDISSSIWLRAVFKTLYENEPRVTILDDGSPYYVYQHGETMLGFHHGHMKKKDGLVGLFAARFSKIWGNTRKRYFHCGHYHHLFEFERDGAKVTQHPTLAPPDAHSVRGGWDSEQEATFDTYHITYGRVEQHTVTPEMLI